MVPTHNVPSLSVKRDMILLLAALAGVEVIPFEPVSAFIEFVQSVFRSEPEVAFRIFGDAGDGIVADTAFVVGMIPESFEVIAVELVQSVAGAEPHISQLVLVDTSDMKL